MSRFFASLCTTAALLAVPALARAEDAKAPVVHAGGVFVGAFFDVFYKKDSRTRSNGAELGTKELNLGGDATVGYMLTDHFALLLNAGGSRDRVTTFFDDAKGGSVSADATTSLGFVAPGARWYFQANDSAYLFLQARAVLGLGTLDEAQIDPKTLAVTTTSYSMKSFALRASPGVSAFLTDHLAAEALIGVVGFSTQRGTSATGGKRQIDDLQLLVYASSLNIGLAYYF